MKKFLLDVFMSERTQEMFVPFPSNQMRHTYSGKQKCVKVPSVRVDINVSPQNYPVRYTILTVVWILELGTKLLIDILSVLIGHQARNSR